MFSTEMGTHRVEPVQETDYFVDFGYGWFCKRCAAQADAKTNSSHGTAGPAHDESEHKQEHFGIARWTNAARQSLFCPNCGLEELISKT